MYYNLVQDNNDQDSKLKVASEMVDAPGIRFFYQF